MIADSEPAIAITDYQVPAEMPRSSDRDRPASLPRPMMNGKCDIATRRQFHWGWGGDQRHRHRQCYRPAFSDLTLTIIVLSGQDFPEKLKVSGSSAGGGIRQSWCRGMV